LRAKPAFSLKSDPSAVTLYGLAAHLRALAAREADYHKRRLLEKRCRACQCAAREALRSALESRR